eukprot:jgi/Galph1/1588/GphlegSOOS_G269.1
MKLSSPLLNPIKNTLWQRLVSANEKREKQLAKKGFSPAGFVIDSVHDLKTSLSIELFDHGFTKDSRKILLPYDCHARSFLRSLELGLLPCYEELPENHTFHYYQGCLIAEIRDYRLSFRGFLNTNVKASHKSSPVTYKVVLRPDAQIICSDIDRTIEKSSKTMLKLKFQSSTCFTPSRLRPDIIRILAFSYNRLLPTKGRSVHCSLQVGRKDNLSFYCESRKTCFRDASIDKNSFITNSLENAMDFADNFRRICEFEGYICILDSLRGPFERSTESVVDSAMDRNTKRNNAPSTSVHVGMPSGIMNNNPNTTGAVQKLPNYPPNVALAQPAWRQTGQPSLRDGGTTLPSSYGKSIRLGETPNTFTSSRFILSRHEK